MVWRLEIFTSEMHQVEKTGHDGGRKSEGGMTSGDPKWHCEAVGIVEAVGHEHRDGYCTGNILGFDGSEEREGFDNIPLGLWVSS